MNKGLLGKNNDAPFRIKIFLFLQSSFSLPHPYILHNTKVYMWILWHHVSIIHLYTWRKTNRQKNNKRGEKQQQETLDNTAGIMMVRIWQGRLISPQDHRGSASKCWNIATHKEMDGENTGRDGKYCWDTKKLKLWQNICLSTTTTQTPNYTINCCPTAFLFTSTHLLWHTNAVELA